MKKNYLTVVRQIDILEGKETKIEVNLELSFGIINVDTSPTGATVYIDGIKKGVTPLIINDVKLGNHTIKLEKEDFNVMEDGITLEGDKECVYRQKLVIIQVVKTFTVNDVTFDMILVKGDSKMHDFYIGKFEVTQKLWCAVMGKKNNPSRSSSPPQPVEMVTYDDCQEFIKKLNKKTKADFRLPTRAEWEYAAKGGKWGDGYDYSGSYSIDDVAWYKGNSGGYLIGNYSRERQEDYYKMMMRPHRAGDKQANELGIYDMSGNVYEFCSDVDAQGYRTAMGGSFTCEADKCKNTSSVHFKPDTKTRDLGLRLVLQY